MTIKDLLTAIGQKHKAEGIIFNPPATAMEITNFERKIGLELPADFQEFYQICNGFECAEDMFRMISLNDVLEHGQDYGKNWFYFAEYMQFSDTWSLQMDEKSQYRISNTGEVEVILTSRLTEFLERFLQGNLFDPGGLYDWHEELKLR